MVSIFWLIYQSMFLFFCSCAKVKILWISVFEVTCVCAILSSQRGDAASATFSLMTILPSAELVSFVFIELSYYWVVIPLIHLIIFSRSNPRCIGRQGGCVATCPRPRSLTLNGPTFMSQCRGERSCRCSDEPINNRIGAVCD